MQPHLPILMLGGSAVAGAVAANLIKLYADTSHSWAAIGAFCAYFIANGLMIEVLRQNVSLSAAITASACFGILLTSLGAVAFQGEQLSARMIAAMGLAGGALWLVGNR